MARLTIGTFNAENLFLRYNFDKKVNIQKYEDKKREGYIKTLKLRRENHKLLWQDKPESVAQVIKQTKADVLALQEIESLDALKQFARLYLGKSYPYYVLIEGNDRRMIDVALLSVYPLSGIKSHQYDRDRSSKKEFIFSRDCLEVNIAPPNSVITLFVTHLDRDNPDQRMKGTRRITEIIQERFASDELAKANFVVLGDLGDTPNSETLRPLLKGRLENVIQRIPDANQRWTVMLEDKPLQHDYLLISPHLTHLNHNHMPHVIRKGHASNHGAIFMELDVENGYVPPRPPPPYL